LANKSIQNQDMELFSLWHMVDFEQGTLKEKYFVLKSKPKLFSKN